MKVVFIVVVTAVYIVLLAYILWRYAGGTFS
jgi:hypothetical protein